MSEQRYTQVWFKDWGYQPIPTGMVELGWRAWFALEMENRHGQCLRPESGMRQEAALSDEGRS